MAIKFGIIGDSGADTFRDPPRGGAYSAVTFGPTDLLVLFRGLDVGTWGAYAEPRRTDYAYNWARSAAEIQDMATQGQISGLVAQIAAAPTDNWYCYVRIGANDFASYSTSFYQPVYAGTLTGSALTTAINVRVNAVLDAVDDLLAAGATGIIARDVPGLINGTNTDAPSIARVQAALDTYNAALAAGMASRSATVAFTSAASLESWNLVTYEGHLGVWLGSEFLSLDTAGDEPHNILLADAVHSGTVFNAMYEANLYVLWPLIRKWGLPLAPFAAAEAWTIAGVSSDGIPKGRISRT